MDISMKLLRKIQLPFSGWHVVSEIGSGTFGSVFRIESRSGDVSALKVIPVPRLEEDTLEALENYGQNVQRARKSFDETVNRIIEREIKTALECRSCENIFDVYEYAVVDDPTNPVMRYILVRMELLMEMRSQLCQPGMRQRDVLHMMRDVANALRYLEARHIIHRDIKPANVMVNGRGVYKVTDFGEARVVQTNKSKTISRGTPYYMAPEVACSGRYDHRADIYSLGIMAYFYLNGMRYPFTQNDTSAYDGYMKRMRGEPCPRLRTVDPRIDSIVQRCIAYRPEQRYAHADELVKDLNELLRDKSVGQQPFMGSAPVKQQATGRSSSLRKRNGTLSNTAITLIIVGAVLGFMMLAGIIVAIAFASL